MIKYLKENETQELMNVLKSDRSMYATRNRAIFYLAKYCALRVSEIGMMHISDYNDLYNEVYCRREKNSYHNTIRIIDSEVIKFMKLYLEERKLNSNNSPFLFISQLGNPINRKTLDHIIKNYCKQTSIPKEKHHFHVLKHTRAVELANSGLDIKEVQWWLGHKNINNTLIYMQFTTKQQEALYQKLERIANVGEDI